MRGEEIMSEGTPAADSLRREVGLVGVVALGLGTAVGVSVFSVLAPAAALAGPALLVSMVIAVVPMAVYALVYAFMGSAAPATGASFEWPRRYVHPFAGFLISWMRIAGSTAALIVLTMVLVSYIGSVVALPPRAAMAGIFLAVFLVNLAGVSRVVAGQSVMLAILLVTCAVYAAGGAGAVEPANFQPFAPAGWAGILAAVPLLVSLFLGIESATEVGGEVRRPGRTIPAGIALSVILTCAVYFAVAVVTIGILGGERLSQSSAPLMEAAGLSLGPAGRTLILACAFVAIGSSINATFVIMTRFLFAMSAAGMLPALLSRTHPRSGVPVAAVCVTFALCCLGLLLPQNLVFLFLAVNIPTLLKYIVTCLSAVGLCRRAPQLREAAAFRLPAWLVTVLAGAGTLLGIAIILLGLEADGRPYILMGAWALAGCAWYLFIVRRRLRRPG